MKIIYVLTDLGGFGGVARVMITKANYFVEKFGYEVVFLLFAKQKDKIQFPLNNKVKLIELNISLYDVPIYKRMFNTIKVIKKVKNILKSQKADFVVSVATIKETSWLYLIKDGSKKIIESHNSRTADVYLSKTIRQKLSFFLIKNSIKKSDAFVVLTKRDEYLWNDTFRNIVAIPNALQYYPDKISSLINKRVIAVGRFSSEKGFLSLIDIWNLIHKNNNDWKLYLFGEGDDYELLINKIKLLKLENSFIICRPTDKIYDEYLTSSIFVLTSEYEGLPTVLMEAAACGLPSVSFDINCGPSDIIEDNVSGYLIKGRNKMEMADKIAYLMNHKIERTEMGKKARKKSLEFSPDNVMIKWVCLFKKLKNNG